MATRQTAHPARLIQSPLGSRGERQEKQALLEAGDFLERAIILTTLLEIGSREDGDRPVRQ